MNDSQSDRRKLPRHGRVEDHGILLARIRPGCDVSVIDVSAGGTLVETLHRLLPGAAVELHLETEHGRVAIRGRVLRCSVSQVRSTCIRYRGAIGFDRHLSWFTGEDDRGYGVHTAERRPGVSARAPATPDVL